MLVTVLLLAGCREEPAAPFECRCSYLTDMDDEITQRELVCAESAARAANVAKGCAARGAAAPVQACACAAAGAGPCRTGECLSPVQDRR